MLADAASPYVCDDSMEITKMHAAAASHILLRRPNVDKEVACGCIRSHTTVVTVQSIKTIRID